MRDRIATGVGAGLLASALAVMVALGIYKLTISVGVSHGPEQRTYTCLDVAALIQHDCVAESDEACEIFADVYMACIEEIEAGRRVCVANPGHRCLGYVEGTP